MEVVITITNRFILHSKFSKHISSNSFVNNLKTKGPTANQMKYILNFLLGTIIKYLSNQEKDKIIRE